jgi:hypothetical protein
MTSRTMNSKPNFFLVGAPKCGTTSLAAWLQRHPNVFLPYKEIHYFDDDHVSPWRPSPEQYAALYQDVGERHIAIGDASVWYLASTKAIPAINAYNPDAKLIVCVRNPIDMAYSLHNQQVFEGTEPITDFVEAWSVQEKRADGYKLRPAVEPFHLMYGPACTLGAQLQRAQSLAGERVLTVFLDDIAARPAETFANVLAFLGVPVSPVDLTAANRAKRRKSPFVKQATRTVGLVKRKLRIRGALGMLAKINAWNETEQPWTARPDVDEMLKIYFADDITLLSSLTGRDLRHWTERGARRPSPEAVAGA